MPERVKQLERIQVAPAVTAGTAVTATKRLLADLTVGLPPVTNVRHHQGAGFKVPVATTVGFEWTGVQIEGELDYNSLAYWLACSLITPTFVTNTGTYAPASGASDTLKTLTLEKGSTVRAEQVAYLVLAALRLRFTLTECSLNASGFGRKRTEGHTITASPAGGNVVQVPVGEQQWEVYIGSAADLSDLAILTRVKEVEFNASDLWVPQTFGNTSQDSFTVHTEGEQKFGGQLVLEYDSNSSALLTQLRAATQKFMRIKAVGPGGASAYQLQIDFPFHWMGLSPADPDGLEGGAFAFELDYASTFNTTGGHLKIALTSDVTAL